MSDHTQPGSGDHRRGSNAGTRRTADPHPQPSSSSTSTSTTTATTVPSSPCGACKFLRRKCTSGCIFAPYFGTDQGAARFAAVHKVFGASNVSKLLTHIPVSRRHDAVVTISYEAQARLSDPVYGCVSTILALQQQVASLQAELAIVQSQLINSQALAVASALETSQHHIGILQPTYSNNSSASTNLTHHQLFTAAATPDMSSCCFAPTSAGNYDPIGHVLAAPPTVERAAAVPPASGHHLFEPYLRLSRPDEEEESRAHHVAFGNQIVR